MTEASVLLDQSSRSEEPFSEDRPIKARPPSLLQWAVKWSRRHQPAMWSMGISAAVVLLLAVAMLTISNLQIKQALDDRSKAVEELQAEKLKRVDIDSTSIRRSLGESQYPDR